MIYQNMPEGDNPFCNLPSPYISVKALDRQTFDEGHREIMDMGYMPASDVRECIDPAFGLVVERLYIHLSYLN